MPFHLLDVGGQLGQRLGVGQDGSGWIPQEADIPHAAESQQDRDVFLQGSRPEVLVHIIGTCRSF